MNQILKRAADILEQPNAWAQGRIAYDSEGTPLPIATHSRACQWCALGAIIKATGEDNQESTDVINVLRRHLDKNDPFYSISAWNDDPSRTQAEVVAAFRAAALQTVTPSTPI